MKRFIATAVHTLLCTFEVAEPVQQIHVSRFYLLIHNTAIALPRARYLILRDETYTFS